MKNLFITLVSVAGVFCLPSCHKDKNTYDYAEGEQIRVEGIEESYNVISERDTLRVNATAYSNLPDADFEYLWGVYDEVRGGPIMDTISRDKELVYPVKLIAKSWVLVHIAKNKTTGVSKLSRASVAVNTNFTTGWYVLKDDEKDSDLDFFFASRFQNIEHKSTDIYSQVNGEKIEGRGGKFSFIHHYKSTVEDEITPANTRTLFVSTEGDVQPIYINTLQKIRAKEDLFLGEPEHSFRGDVVFYSSPTQYLVNNGQLHTLNVMPINRGQFGAKIRFDNDNTSYSLSRYYLPGDYSYFFDETSSTFVTLPQGYGTVFSPVENVIGTTMSAQNNNQRLVYMGYKKQTYLPKPEYRYVPVGYGIFVDKSNPNLRSIVRLEPNKANLKITKTVINSSDKLYDGKLHTLLAGDEEMMYFVGADGNVYSRNLVNGFEQKQFSVAGAEEVTFIKHLRHSAIMTPFNYVAIGVKDGGAYRVLMFEKSAGNLRSAPRMTLDGNGVARDVIYINPGVNAETYKPVF